MTPAQSVENFYQEELEEEDDEALSVAGTEYSEAPSVARSYTISQNSNQVKKILDPPPKKEIILLPFSQFLPTLQSIQKVNKGVLKIDPEDVKRGPKVINGWNYCRDSNIQSLYCNFDKITILRHSWLQIVLRLQKF